MLQGEPMRIVYRMRGLLGDATEDMVNTLETGKGVLIILCHKLIIEFSCGDCSNISSINFRNW